MLAFKDIYPKAPVHLLIIPKRHIESLARLEPGDAELVGRCVLVARELGERAGYAERGYRLVVQLRPGRRAGGLSPALSLHGGPAVIQVRGLSKDYAGGVKALDDVSFDVEPGQFVALIGPSGAGKSSLLRCLNGFVTPTAGRVTVDGAAVTGAGREELRRIRARIGFVFQQFNLLRRLSVLDNVLVGRLAHASGLEVRHRVVRRLRRRAGARRASPRRARGPG